MLEEEIGFAVTSVLSDPQRLGYLLAGGVNDALDLRRFFVKVVPLARASIAELDRLAQRIPDDDLRAKAQSNLRHKAYHVAGACILATFLPSAAREHYVEIVAPLESIYDLLDTLCDREPHPEERASRQLHLALFDALDPARTPSEYFLYGPPGDDGDYLNTLVRRVRRHLRRLSDYELLVPHFTRAAQLYADTQTFKHLPAAQREQAYSQWYGQVGPVRDLTWWEFAAAAGSQFHVYGALYAAFCSEYDRIGDTYSAYFPEFAALHVLLDSFIDQAEDLEHGELSWIACYPDTGDMLARVHELAERARIRFDTLAAPDVHRFALRIMCLFYLTHPKVWQQSLNHEAAALLAAVS